MTTTSVPRNVPKPFFDIDVEWFRRINYIWWLQRLPMALLAIPAAYGVGAFSYEHLPLSFAIILGISFECTYLGAIAIADQQYDEDWISVLLWWLVNLGAVSASVISNLLFVSGNTFSGITAESYAHALPMPILGFLYGLLLHRMSSKAAAEAHAEAKQEESTIFCDCGRKFTGAKSAAERNGHRTHCKVYKDLKTQGAPTIQ